MHPNQVRKANIVIPCKAQTASKIYQIDANSSSRKQRT